MDNYMNIKLNAMSNEQLRDNLAELHLTSVINLNMWGAEEAHIQYVKALIANILRQRGLMSAQ